MTEKKSIRAAKKRRMDHSRTEISQIKTICEIKLPPASYLWEGYRK